jgi:3-hydroxyacyl-[acyl-carrier-protein] dehydratase
MRFQLVDRIEEVVPGERIRAVKNLTLGEEYLADHFPSFPVMPGVLMLEALVQTAAWLVRATTDFADTILVLQEAKGIKYGTFVEPGRQLRLLVEPVGQPQDITAATFKGTGEIDGNTAVLGRFTLRCYCLKDQKPELASLDEQLRNQYRLMYVALTQGVPLTVAESL